MPIPHLRVLRILDFRPAGGAAVGAVRPTCPLRSDPFKVAFTGHSEQINAAKLDVIEVQQSRFDGRHDAQQLALALEQLQARQILAVDAEDIERIEVRPLTSE